MAKISDGLFLVIDLVFRIFPFFSQIFRIFTMLNVVYDPLLTRKTTISEKNSFVTPFFYSARTFARIRQHYFSKYWGGRMHGPSPPLILGGTVPQSPRSPPMAARISSFRKSGSLSSSLWFFFFVIMAVIYSL